MTKLARTRPLQMRRKHAGRRAPKNANLLGDKKHAPITLSCLLPSSARKLGRRNVVKSWDAAIKLARRRDSARRHAR
jgi:hypothetical protein